MEAARPALVVTWNVEGRRIAWRRTSEFGAFVSLFGTPGAQVLILAWREGAEALDLHSGEVLRRTPLTSAISWRSCNAADGEALEATAGNRAGTWQESILEVHNIWSGELQYQAVLREPCTALALLRGKYLAAGYESGRLEIRDLLVR